MYRGIRTNLRRVKGGAVETEATGGRVQPDLLFRRAVTERRPDVDAERLRDVDCVFRRHVDGLDVLGRAELVVLRRWHDISLLVLENITTIVKH